MHSNHILDGLLLINKPDGITSFDCIRRLRRSTGVKKIGHAGTLDPSATGLMLMLFGTACKQAERFSKLDKTYIAEITLGQTSTTGDREGTITPYTSSSTESHEGASDWGSRPTKEEVEAALQVFVGEIQQTPSMYSAIKIDGKEAYKRARAGESVAMSSRTVTIHSIKLLEYEYPIIKLEADVSSGTYIRSLAADLGEKLATGAYLSNLVRTRVGDYSLDDAIELNSDPTVIARSLSNVAIS